MSDKTDQTEETPSGDQRPGVSIIILAAVLAALGAFFVRRAL